MSEVLERRESDVSAPVLRTRSAMPTSFHAGAAPSVWQGAGQRTAVTATAPDSRPKLRMRVIVSDSGRLVAQRALVGDPSTMDWKVESEAAAPAAAVESPRAEAEWLKASLNLSMAELAELSGRSRKAVYDWFDETEAAAPQQDARDRMAGIRSVFDGFDAEKLKFARRVWSSAPREGASLLALLKQIDSPASAHVVAAREALAALGPVIDSLAQRGSSKPPKHDLGSAHTADLYRWS